MPVSPQELARSIGGADTFADMLRRVRHDRGFSETEIATRLQRPVEFIVRLEAGDVSDPDLLTVSQLARSCEVSAALLAVSFALPSLEPLPWPRERWPSPGGIGADDFPGAPRMGAALRDARHRQGWTIRELADRTGVHRSYLASLERGAVARPGLLMLVRLAHGFVALRAARLGYVALLAMSYAGEIPARRPTSGPLRWP